MELLAQNILNGVTIGTFYALVALGYTMVYGVLKLINFAHGDLFMWGAYLGYTGFTLLLGLGLHGGPWMIVPVTLGAMFVVALGGVLLERTAYRPLRHAGRLPPIISALGAAFILESLARNIYGATYITYPTNIAPTGRMTLMGDVTVSTMQIILLVAAFVLMGILWLFVNYTPRRHCDARRVPGPRHLAPDGHRCQPHHHRRLPDRPGVGRGRWRDGGPVLRIVRLHPGMTFGLKAFIAAILGGIGNIPGAMLGGLLLGLVESFGASYLSPTWKDVIAYALLALFLIVRPTGLLGERVAEKL